MSAPEGRSPGLKRNCESEEVIRNTVKRLGRKGGKGRGSEVVSYSISAVVYTESVGQVVARGIDRTSLTRDLL